jgi:hypothetical protein
MNELLTSVLTRVLIALAELGLVWLVWQVRSRAGVPT